jgi:Lrp/AsnC family leucine-responsive transcriptional regulator
MPVDALDSAILNVLKENGRAPAAAIGKRVNLSVPAVLERMKKLTQAGIIEGYTVKISRQKTCRKLLAFVFVQLKENECIQPFREEVVRLDGVLECHHMAGEYDYLLKVAVEDTAALEEFLTGSLKSMKGVAATNTMIVLKSLKEEINA